MKLVVISYHSPIDGEIPALLRMFEEGLEYFHLRRYDMDEADVIAMIKSVPSEFRSRIALHHHHHLAEEYGVGGIHFSSRTDIKDAAQMSEYFRTSASCHSIEQAVAVQNAVTYCFLSPIYDSISKLRYHTKFPDHKLLREQLTQVSETDVIALGGITPEKVDEVRQIGFNGAAVLGSLWQPMLDHGDSEGTVTKFKQLADRCKSDHFQYQ